MNLPNIATEINQTVRVIRLLEDELLASDVAIKIELTFDSSDQKPELKTRMNAMITWITEYLNGSIIYNTSTDFDTTLFEEIANNLIMSPDEPHDYILAMLIHSKLSAFGGQQITIISTSIESDTSHGFLQKVSGDVSTVLPDIKSWIGPRHFHSVPWWGRTDASTVDMQPEDHEDLSKIPELGKELVPCESHSNDAAVIKPVFRPRVITNDD